MEREAGGRVLVAAEEQEGGKRWVNVSELTDRLETVGYQHGGGEVCHAL